MPSYTESDKCQYLSFWRRLFIDLPGLFASSFSVRARPDAQHSRIKIDDSLPVVWSVGRVPCKNGGRRISEAGKARAAQKTGRIELLAALPFLLFFFDPIRQCRPLSPERQKPLSHSRISCDCCLRETFSHSLSVIFHARRHRLIPRRSAPNLTEKANRTWPRSTCR
jgi:hypothetical protein